MSSSFETDPYVHGVACGLKEKFGISDKVYSALVHGLDAPVTSDGELADSMSDAAAIMVIQPPLMAGGIPWPVITPIYGPGSEPNTVNSSAEEVPVGEMVSYYDPNEERSRVGYVLDKDTGEGTVTVMHGDMDEVKNLTASEGALEAPEVNGVSVEQDDFSMANSDDEHKKDWWKLEKHLPELLEEDDIPSNE